LSIHTLQNYKLKKNQLIPGKVYSKTQNINNEQKQALIPFSIFKNRYVDEQIFIWQKKGGFEKTSDWQTRVNEETKNLKIEELNEDAILSYAKSLHVKLGFCYIGASLSLGQYDADKEIYIIKSKNFGDLEVPVPIDEAQQFKSKSWCSDESNPSNVIFFIVNDQLALAQATFWKKYKYENPLAKNRIKSKKEIASESDEKKEIENKIYNSAGIEKEPEFKGGIKNFYKFLSKNYVTPKEEGLRGKIFVSFVIEIDGTLTDIKVIKDIGYGTGEEAIRVLSLCPKWIPGEDGGKKVRVGYSTSINIQSSY